MSEPTPDKVDVNRAVAITSYGEVVMVDYFFIHTPTFFGVTGSTFRPVSAEEYATAEDVETVAERVEEMWRVMVHESNETRGLTEYAQALIDNGEAESALWDESYSEHHDTLRASHPSLADAATFDATGGGRCFSPEAWEGYATVLDAPLLALVQRLETREQDDPAQVMADLRAYLDATS